MAVMNINDAELVEQIEQIAAREARSVEDVLRAWVIQSQSTSRPTPPGETSPPPDTATNSPDPAHPERSAGWYRVRRKAYAKARRYWSEAGDKAKAALTDEQLHEQFAYFDAEGIPRLQSEVDMSVEPRPGSARSMAKMAQAANIRTRRSLGAEEMRRILREEFGQHLASELNQSEKDATS